jgi:hypothetical protein
MLAPRPAPPSAAVLASSQRRKCFAMNHFGIRGFLYDDLPIAAGK